MRRPINFGAVQVIDCEKEKSIFVIANGKFWYLITYVSP